MKKIHVLGIVVGLLLVLAVVPIAAGQSATTAPWTNSITFYTPSDTGGTMAISYYAEGSSTPVDEVIQVLSPHAAGSLYIGATDVPSGFEGAAVLSAEVPIIATSVQFASGSQSNQYARLLYSGFSPDLAASDFFIPTVLNQKFGSSTTVGIQNTEASEIDVTVKLFASGSTTPTATKDYKIPAQSTQISTATELGAPAGFTGSATIEATGNVVATAQETQDAGRGAYAFEGVASGAETVYMASMLCNAFGGQNSFYAIQNASFSDTANYTIDFYDTAGNKIATKPSASLGPAAKVSINPCNYGVSAGTSGSAVIKGDTGDALIAIGKVSSPSGVATAWTGASAGSTKSAAGYIRWSANPYAEFRAFVAVMNVGTGTASGCTAVYYDADGNGTTQTLPDFEPFIKTNTTASAAGALSNGDFGTSKTAAGVGGALEVECNQPVIVVARLAKSVNLGSTTSFAEDYGSSPVQ